MREEVGMPEIVWRRKRRKYPEGNDDGGKEGGNSLEPMTQTSPFTLTQNSGHKNGYNALSQSEKYYLIMQYTIQRT